MEDKDRKVELDLIAKQFVEFRAKLDLTQSEAAELFGVKLRTWQDWEYGVNKPTGSSLKLLQIYEHNPPQKTNVSQLCSQIRKKLGLKKGEMAKMLGVLPNTWGYWEKGVKKPKTSALKKLQLMLKELEEKELPQAN